MDQPSKKKSLKNFFKSFVREIIVPIVLALIVIQYVIQAFQIPSGSMEDSLLTGDFLLGLKFTYGSPIPFSNQKFPGYTLPQTGDVVIFRYPGEPEYPENNPSRYTHLFNALMFGNFYWDKDPKEGQPHLVHYADGPKDYIKRCVAVSGDTVAVKQGRLYINGNRQDTLPGLGKWTLNYRTHSPRDEKESFIVPSVGDTFEIAKMPLEKLWWIRSLIIQENPNDHVELELSLFKNGVEENNYEFADFKVPVENDRGLLINDLLQLNRVILQNRLVEGDTISGQMSFAYFKELARIGFLPAIDPLATGSWKRQVSYIGLDASILRDLEGNVNTLNATSSQDSTDSLTAVDSLEQVQDHFEIQRKITINGNPIEKYVVQSPQFFMMGDNRDNSADSRFWGFVALRNIKAKAFVIYFSFENSDQDFALGNPFTWWKIPLKIRWSRIGKIIHMIEK